ncbi:MAG TPA: heterodisulfide reductase-related iron-sulfur binding cluster [Candidatus Saccharimonadales bacterium]|nr:heterodisulfide reductase-related iron-sulfur binding cluster [Candidatus Saccharimonadales bacterium]
MGPRGTSGHPRDGAATVAFDDHHRPDAALISDCVHCGFCLPACPTYLLWGEEMDSPRGRIVLMDLAERGEIGLDREVVRHWDACLGCMACVDACPSGVQYNRLIEQVRPQVERRFTRDWRSRAGRAALFALLPYPRRMRSVATAVAVTQALGLRRVLRSKPVQRVVPRMLRRLDGMAPDLRLADLRARTPRRLAAEGASVQRVAMLTGCVQDAFFSHVNRATARVLAAYGCDVLTPPLQSCCGALEIHAGREAPALARARALITQMERMRVDHVVVNSAGCGSAMKEYGVLLADDPLWAQRASRFSAKVRDVMEVLADLEVQLPARLHPLPARVAYHDACHLAHAQGVRSQPRAVLRRIPGLDLVEIAESDVCCGSAGIYNLVAPQAADDLGDRKAASVDAAHADFLTAGNGGCLLQIQAALRRSGRPLPVLHPVELLDASLRGMPTAMVRSAGHR